MSNQPCFGSVLASSEIVRRSGEVFAVGWEPANVRAAKYYLRIAQDGLVLPNGRQYPPGKRRRRGLVLEPGDVMFVSTRERFRMPWDLSGQISLRFGYAVDGALVLTGGVVDPGYGTQSGNGEPLHFIIANIGPNPLPINPGEDQIAALQLFAVCGDAARENPASTRELEERMFDAEEPPDLALEFFEGLTSRVDKLTRRLDRVEAGTRQVVFFGIFLVAATLLGVAVVQLLELSSVDSISRSVDRLLKVLPDSWPATISLIAILLVGTFVFAGTVYLLGHAIAWLLNLLRRSAAWLLNRFTRRAR